MVVDQKKKNTYVNHKREKSKYTNHHMEVDVFMNYISNFNPECIWCIYLRSFLGIGLSYNIMANSIFFLETLHQSLSFHILKTGKKNQKA